MKKKLCLALIITALSTSAFAHRNYDNYGFGYNGYGPGYYGFGNQQIYVAPTPYYAPAPAPVYIQQPAQEYWYFCKSSNAYYPYVKGCTEGWMQVVPQ